MNQRLVAFLFLLVSSAGAFPRPVTANLPLSQRLATLGASDGNARQATCSADRSTIQEFLSEGPSTSLEDFHIHGWRWHTMSLAREAERLKQLAQQPAAEESLKKAADYVVGFNLKGLHKIENNIFFPWVREKLTSETQPDLSRAFANVIDGLEADRKAMAALGENILEKADLASDQSRPASLRASAVDEVAQDASRLADMTKSIKDVEDSLIVPAIAKIVPASAQKSFSNRVLLGLGVLDSRLHLVGMHEALFGKNGGSKTNIDEERRLFRLNIPSIPQKMIPRWKRKIYAPAAGVMDC